MKCLLSVRVILTLIAVAICAQQIVNLVVNFFKSDKWTMTTIYKDVDVMELPEITICNSNQINVTLAAEIGINDNALLQMIKGTHLESQWIQYFDKLNGAMSLSDVMFQAIVGGVSSLNIPIPLTSIAEMCSIDALGLQSFQSDMYEMYYNKSQIPYRSLYRALAHTCDMSLIQCFTEGYPWLCCGKSEQIFTSSGVCTKLRPQAVKQTSKGSQAGYQIMYELRTDSYVTNVVGTLLSSGLTLILGYYNNITTEVFIEPNTNAMIKVHNVEEKVEHTAGWDGSFFPPPCRDPEHGSAAPNRERCHQECLGRLALYYCQCDVVGLSTKIRQCEAHEALRCSQNRILHESYYFYHDPNISINQITIPWSEINQTYTDYSECRKSCIRPCEQVRISATVTSTKLITSERTVKLKQFMELLGRTMPTNYISSNFVILNIYFDNFSIQQNILVPMATFNQLISLIGGQLGLWVGASIVTLINLIPRFGGRFCWCNGPMARSQQMVPENTDEPK